MSARVRNLSACVVAAATFSVSLVSVLHGARQEPPPPAAAEGQREVHEPQGAGRPAGVPAARGHGLHVGRVGFHLRVVSRAKARRRVRVGKGRQGQQGHGAEDDWVDPRAERPILRRPARGVVRHLPPGEAVSQQRPPRVAAAVRRPARDAEGTLAALPPGTRPPAPRETSDEVIAKYFAAIGGEAAAQKITSAVMRGTATNRSGVSVPVTVWQKAPGRYRITTEAAAAMTRSYDGHGGWMKNGETGRDLHVVERQAVAAQASPWIAARLKSSLLAAPGVPLRANRRARGDHAQRDDFPRRDRIAVVRACLGPARAPPGPAADGDGAPASPD